MKIGLEDRLPRKEILDFVSTFPHVTFFHTPTWMEILTTSFPHFNARWITVRSDRELIGIMPVVEIRRGSFRTMWALPFGTYGDPIALTVSTQHALLETFFQLAGAVTCLEAGVTFFSPGFEGVLPDGVDVRTEECRVIHLHGSFQEYRTGALSKKRRQLCHRALRAGIEVRPIEEEREVEELHRLYSIEARTWGGPHPYPVQLFRELLTHRGEGVILWGGFLGGRLLGGHINFYFKEMGQAWQAAMSEDASEYEVSALLILEAVREAYARGMRIFNLGSSGGNRGIIFFKESMGGKEHLYRIATVRKKWWSWLKGR